MVKCDKHIRKAYTDKDLYIFTYKEFRQWCTTNNEHNRFRHIFIDEGHRITSRELIYILDNHTIVEQTKNQHFWVLCNFLQNRRWENKDWKIDLERNPKWNRKENHFTTYYLKYVFRQTQNQFLSLLPIIEKIRCPACSETNHEGMMPNLRALNSDGSKFICPFCHPYHGVVAIGQELLNLTADVGKEDLNKLNVADEFDAIVNPGPDNPAEFVSLGLEKSFYNL